MVVAAADSAGQQSLVEFDRLRLERTRLRRVASAAFLRNVLRDKWLRRSIWRGRRIRGRLGSVFVGHYFRSGPPVPMMVSVWNAAGGRDGSPDGGRCLSTVSVVNGLGDAGSGCEGLLPCGGGVGFSVAIRFQRVEAQV